MKRSITVISILWAFCFFACSKKTVPTSTVIAPRPAVIEHPVIKDTVVYKAPKEIYKPYVPPFDINYKDALAEMESMLLYPEKLSFKRAVFLTENAYCNDTLNYEKFNRKISALTQMCQLMIKANRLVYGFEDSVKVAKYAAAFKLITEGVPMLKDSNKVAYFPPYVYDFEDFAGNKDWNKMFVSKLLETHNGNCHSLPFLYKIIVEELGETANLALAPNHIYIKHQIKKTGWYNSELTSGIFPNDAWLMASGYIKLEAIQNGVYMKALDQKQSIAICITDLAQGFEKKFGVKDGEFILKCCELALTSFPNYINALMLKSETQKKLFDAMMKKQKAEFASEMFSNPKAKQLFNNMTITYADIHKTGYRKMPDKMYLDWLVSLKTEKAKYQNKNLNFNNSK